MGIKKFIKDITGVTAREEIAKAEELARLDLVKKTNEKLKKEKSEARKKEKEEKIRKAAEAEAKLSPKERATKKKEPWVDVIDFKVNTDNIRNGFFELDWNEYFIVQLRNEGYGLEGDPEEEIVERWYRDICRHVAAEDGVVMEHRPAGNLNLTVRKLPDNKSEIG